MELIRKGYKMNDTVIIESYEPYHIGSKLFHYVNLPKLVRKIQDYIEENKKLFEVNRNAFSKDAILSPNVKITNKVESDLSVHLNLTASALNVASNNPKEVIELSQEIMNILPELGFDLDSTFVFYEVVINVIFRTKSDSINIFKNISNVNILEGSDYPEMITNQIRFSDKQISKENEDLIEITLSTYKTSPRNRIILRFIQRVFNYNDLKYLNENYEKVLLKIYKNIRVD